MAVGFSDSQCTHAYAYSKSRPTQIMEVLRSHTHTRMSIANAVHTQCNKVISSKNITSNRVIRKFNAVHTQCIRSANAVQMQCKCTQNRKEYL